MSVWYILAPLFYFFKTSYVSFVVLSQYVPVLSKFCSVMDIFPKENLQNTETVTLQDMSI